MTATQKKQHQQVHWYFGMDLGQKRDHSALAVVEYLREWNLERNYVTYAMDPVDETVRVSVRQLQRIDLGTKYTDLAMATHRLLQKATRTHDCTLVLDASGVGQPVTELFEGLPPRATLVPVTIVPGAGETKGKDEWRVSKQVLISGLQVMLEAGQLTIAADLKFASALLEEMVEMRSCNDWMSYAS